jgi:hypothetical protein
MSTKVPSAHLQRTLDGAGAVISGTLSIAIRSAALVLFLAMSMAEPVVAVVLSGMALALFAVSVVFGFILHAHFPHRWFVLGASIVFLLAYLLYRFIMLGVQRLIR